MDLEGQKFNPEQWVRPLPWKKKPAGREKVIDTVAGAGILTEVGRDYGENTAQDVGVPLTSYMYLSRAYRWNPYLYSSFPIANAGF